MSTTHPAIRLEPKAKILELLDENHVMSVATVRPDGWPQVTLVGYAHDDLTLYFAVARTSQKLANIRHEPRISIALGHDTAERIRGVSMAAHAAEVTDLAEVEHLNQLLLDRYPEQTIFWPRELSTAILRATPTVISIIDLAKGPGEPELVQVQAETTVYHVRNTAADQAAQPGGAARDDTVLVNYRRSNPGEYRPGAPL
jgi:nitroimidazol reductase NimA-like FMN-containing flavoprotein (pyridoxamine 5'-phosphate oxidase superfamily)